jgi:hypothetical protein
MASIRLRDRCGIGRDSIVPMPRHIFGRAPSDAYRLLCCESAAHARESVTRRDHAHHVLGQEWDQAAPITNWQAPEAEE